MFDISKDSVVDRRPSSVEMWTAPGVSGSIGWTMQAVLEPVHT